MPQSGYDLEVGCKAMASKSTSVPTSRIDGRRKAAMKDGGASYLARREEIVHVAAHVFRELGYEAATLNDVARQLGTDRASLYYYVASKDELLHEVVRGVLARNLAAAEEIRKRRIPVPEKIAALILEMITSFDENYPHMYVYIEDMGRVARQDSEWARDVVHSTKQFETIVREIIEKGRRDGTLKNDIPAELSAMGLFGMVNWTHRWYKPGHKFDPQDIAKAFTTLFLSGATASAEL
jgi:AcrR family transcriptional regulator